MIAITIRTRLPIVIHRLGGAGHQHGALLASAADTGYSSELREQTGENGCQTILCTITVTSTITSTITITITITRVLLMIIIIIIIIIIMIR